MSRSGSKPWQTLQRRIDALSLRERVFMFVSAAVVAVAVADAVVISPLLTRQRALAAQLVAQGGELDALRQQVAIANASSSADSPAGRLQAALRTLHAEREALERELAPPPGPNAPRLADLLARVLQRHERLSLVRLDVAVAEAASPSDPAAPRQQAVDLAVQGSYADLVAYLAEIEGQLPGLRWGPLQLGGGAEAPLLTLRLFLPGVPA
jgi:MSHA biogenesis protein MshJ